jgi:hypothetical protein
MENLRVSASQGTYDFKAVTIVCPMPADLISIGRTPAPTALQAFTRFSGDRLVSKLSPADGD